MLPPPPSVPLTSAWMCPSNPRSLPRRATVVSRSFFFSLLRHVDYVFSLREGAAREGKEAVFFLPSAVLSRLAAATKPLFQPVTDDTLTRPLSTLPHHHNSHLGTKNHLKNKMGSFGLEISGNNVQNMPQRAAGPKMQMGERLSMCGQFVIDGRGAFLRGGGCPSNRSPCSIALLPSLLFFVSSVVFFFVFFLTLSCLLTPSPRARRR